MEVKVLGTGCPNCKRLEKVTRQALDELVSDQIFINQVDHEFFSFRN